MKNLPVLILFMIFQTLVSAQTVNYTASNSIIANPERGLQKYSITGTDYHTNTNANNLSNETLTNWKNSTDKVTVVYRLFLLNEFLNSDINTTYLSNIQTDFDNIRSAGLKVIVRFAYTDEVGSTAQQPTKSQILTHISQLTTVLNTNEDVIFSLQAGFIGTWGEWYYTNSSEFGTEDTISSTQWNNRKEVLDAMLTATPISIPVQVRYAGIKKTLYGDIPLTPNTAYGNTANARIGFFNDAFLNNWGDQATYSVSSECENPVGNSEYNYIANETKYLPMTGETNGINPCDNGFRTTGANAIDEMQLTNWTTLNRDYYIPFWDGIISSGHYDEILKKLGYRFVLNSSTALINGNILELTLNINNIGFARAFKQRNVYLVFENTDTNSITTKLINTDIRTWEDTVTISQNFDLENSGTFKLYLWMPDIDASLQNNPDYSIRFANENTWQPSTGYNDLLQTITVNTLNIDDLSLQDKISIYPNPTSSFITIDYKNHNINTVQIRNAIGQLIIEKTTEGDTKIDVSQLSKGLYYITLNNDKQLAQKFIKN